MRSNAVFLKFMYEASTKQRAAILTHITKPQINVLSEVALNIYKGVFPNRQKYVNSLKPHKSIIFRLGSKSVGALRKKQLLIRNNKLIPNLIRPVIDFI